MPDSEEKVELEMFMEDGQSKKVSEEELTKMLSDEINVVEVTASFGISCQIKEYHPHTKHMSFKNALRTQNIAKLFKDDERKQVSKMASGMLFAKIAAQGAAAHRAMMTEFIKDGFDPNILPWRTGEREKVMGDE